MTRCFPIATALLTLGLLAPVGLAQDALQVEADIEFAEGLARRWQFVDLAEEVLDGISKNHTLTAAQSENLGLVRCEVFATAARRERDADERNRLYASAIQSYQDFIADHEYSDLKPQAERAMVQLSNSYAGVLELQLGDLVGEEATAVREQIRVLLEGPLTRTGSLVADLSGISDPTETQKRERASLMLDRGRMLATMGRVSEDGTFYFGQAESVLEDLALEFGERSGWGLQSYLEMARVKGAQGRWSDASVFFQFVVNSVMPPDPETWAVWSNELTQADKELYWTYTELSIPGLLEAAVADGDTTTAMSYALLFWNRYKTEGFTLSLPRGYMALLASASTILDIGGYIGGRTTGGDLQWFETQEEMAAKESSKRNQRSAVDMALLMAQTVNEDNRGNNLQTRAQKLISEIIERPGVVLGPEMLFEAAQGQYADRNYEEAIRGCKRVLAALEGKDAAERAEFGPKVLNKLGKSYAGMDRYLEAAMVFREAVTVWSGDPEFDNQNAKGMLAAVQILRGKTNGDELIQQLFLEAENHVTRTTSTGDTGEIVFRQGMRLYDSKDYDSAIEKFSEIEPSSDSYEKALVYQGACLYRTSRFDEAVKVFNQYLVEYLGDAKNQTTSESRLARRLEARALATFYLGSISYKEKRYEEVTKLLSRFYSEFPGQDQMAPNAIYMALISDLALNEVQAARDLYELMVEHFADNRFTGIAAKRIYSEVSKLHAASLEGSAERAALLQTQAELMKTANALSNAPRYDDLRREAGHWQDLQNWTEAERVLRRTSKLFKDDPKERKGWHMNVQPDLGQVLIAQNKLPEALEVLRALIPPVKTPEGEADPEFRPYSSTVMNYFVAAVGTTQFDERVTEVLGVGTAEDIELAADWMDTLSNGKDKYTPEWYQLKYNLIFAWRRMGQSDSAKKKVAKRQLTTMQTDCGNTFEGIAEDFVKAGLPGEPLRQQYLWLNKQLN